MASGSVRSGWRKWDRDRVPTLLTRSWRLTPENNDPGRKSGRRLKIAHSSRWGCRACYASSVATTCSTCVWKPEAARKLANLYRESSGEEERRQGDRYFGVFQEERSPKEGEGK